MHLGPDHWLLHCLNIYYKVKAEMFICCCCIFCSFLFFQSRISCSFVGSKSQFYLFFHINESNCSWTNERAFVRFICSLWSCCTRRVCGGIEIVWRQRRRLDFAWRSINCYEARVADERGEEKVRKEFEIFMTKNENFFCLFSLARRTVVVGPRLALTWWWISHSRRLSLESFTGERQKWPQSPSRHSTTTRYRWRRSESVGQESASARARSSTNKHTRSSLVPTPRAQRAHTSLYRSSSCLFWDHIPLQYVSKRASRAHENKFIIFIHNFTAKSRDFFFLFFFSCSRRFF